MDVEAPGRFLICKSWEILATIQDQKRTRPLRRRGGYAKAFRDVQERYGALTGTTCRRGTGGAISTCAILSHSSGRATGQCTILNSDHMQPLGLNPDPEYTVDSVYGINRDVPLNYTTRSAVDDQFVMNLARDKHLVVYGSSKQGKTCLRKHCLNEDDYIVVQCSNRWSLEDIHSNVLKRAGFKITQSEKRSATGKNKILASIGVTMFGIGSKAGAEAEQAETAETVTKELELDPADVNDVIAALRQIEFSRTLSLKTFTT